jgi:hypothetical protein
MAAVNRAFVACVDLGQKRILLAQVKASYEGSVHHRHGALTVCHACGTAHSARAARALRDAAPDVPQARPLVAACLWRLFSSQRACNGDTVAVHEQAHTA